MSQEIKNLLFDAVPINTNWINNFKQFIAKENISTESLIKIIQKKYEENSNQKDAYSRMGFFELKKNNYQKAKELFERDISQNKSSVAMKQKYIEVLYKGEEKICVEWIEQCYKKHPHAKNFYALLGKLFELKKNNKKALYYYEKDLELNKMNPGHMRNFGVLLYLDDQKEKSLKLIDEAYSKNHLLTDGYALIAWRYYWPVREIAKAIEYLEKDYSLKRLSYNYNARLVSLYCYNNNYNKAEQLLERINNEVLYDQNSKDFFEKKCFFIHNMLLERVYSLSKNLLKGGGVYIENLPQDYAEDLVFFTENSSKTTNLSAYLNPCKLRSKFSEKKTDQLNANQIFVDPDCCYDRDCYEYRPIDCLQKIAFCIKDKFSDVVGCPFVIVGIRGWLTQKSATRFGPNAEHIDGFPPGHLKVMVYPRPLNENNGYLKINGRAILTKSPCMIILENSIVYHQSMPGNKNDRISWEFTLMKIMMEPNKSHFLHFATPHSHYERHLSAPSLYYLTNSIREVDVRRIDPIASDPPKNLNIGSGRTVLPGWICIDELDHPGITKISINEKTIFPIRSSSMQLVYSSHHLEHLPDETVEQVLKEGRRVISDNGYLLLKLPDFEGFLEAYSQSNKEFLDYASQGGVKSVTWCWKQNGVELTIENCISMMFCGYWNNNYGDHFSGRVNRVQRAYHGPAKMNQDKLKDLLLQKNIRNIVKELSIIAKQDSEFKQFNHQNAWSRSELSILLEEHDFRVVSMNRKEILNAFSYVPKLDASNSNWSMFVLAEPKK